MKESARCEKDAESLATSDVYRDESTDERTRPMTSEYRTWKHQQVLDSHKNSPQRRIDNPSQSARDATGSQNNCIQTHGSLNGKFCDIKSEKKRNSSRLKIVVCWRYLEDRGCPTLSRSIVARSFLPCKPSDLMRRIFTADPLLTESCLIIMRRKFEISIRNVCSCLNDVLVNVDVAVMQKMRLDCKIYPGYISFKLKIGGAGNKYLFVTRVPICQNVRKRRDFLAFACDLKLSSETGKSNCSKQRENNGDNNDALACLSEKSEKLDDIRCSKLHRSTVEDATVRTSRNKVKSNNKEGIAHAGIEDISKCKDFTISCCGKSCENIVEEISDMTLCVNNSGEKNAEYRKSLNSKENDCDTREREAVDSSIAKNDESISDINCQCRSRKNFIAVNNETREIFPMKNLDSLSRTADIDECDWICSSESNWNEDRNTCSIASFVQNSERDKELVELNCNRLSSNDVKAIAEQSEDDSILNSAKTEIACDSNCSCRYTDFIDITVVDNTSENSIVRASEVSRDDTLEIPSTNYSKTVLSKNNNSTFVRAPKLKISSKDIDVDVSCSRTIIWLASGDDRTVSAIAKTRNSRDTLPSTRALIVPRREKQILDGIDFIESPDRRSTLEGIRSSDSSARNYFCVKNRAMSGISRKSRKLKKSKLGKCKCLSNGNATSSTMLKCRTMHRHHRDDDFVDARTLVMTSFRDSVDRSIEGIKYLRAKLERVLFKDRVKAKRH